MGIYSNGKIFGIRIYSFKDDDDICNTLYEKIYDTIMSDEQCKEAYYYYNDLFDKKDIFFKVYTECSSTYNRGATNFMMWHPMSLEQFLEKFTVVIMH